MTRIDVAHGASHRLQVAANTVYKHYRNGRPIWVYCTDQKRMQAFSKMLWSVEDTAFVPHQNIQDGFNNCLVYLCFGDPAEYLPPWQQAQAATPAEAIEQGASSPSTQSVNKPILLNLDLACPPNLDSFERILEIVSTHPGDQDYARERIRHYKQLGLQTVFHQLGT